MTDPKHGFTAGEWIAGPADSVMCGSSIIAQVYAGGDHPTQNRRVTRQANARLIAAAPDLFEALSSVTDTLTEILKNSSIEGYDEVISSARSTLAKAVQS